LEIDGYFILKQFWNQSTVTTRTASANTLDRFKQALKASWCKWQRPRWTALDWGGL